LISSFLLPFPFLVPSRCRTTTSLSCFTLQPFPYFLFPTLTLSYFSVLPLPTPSLLLHRQPPNLHASLTHFYLLPHYSSPRNLRPF
jgi:hypothetical protein